MMVTVLIADLDLEPCTALKKKPRFLKQEVGVGNTSNKIPIPECPILWYQVLFVRIENFDT